MLRGLVVSPEDVYCYCYCVIVLLLLLLCSIFFILLRGLVVSPEDGLAAPLVAVVVAIALSVAPDRIFGILFAIIFDLPEYLAYEVYHLRFYMKYTCHKQILANETFHKKTNSFPSNLP